MVAHVAQPERRHLSLCHDEDPEDFFKIAGFQFTLEDRASDGQTHHKQRRLASHTVFSSERFLSGLPPKGCHPLWRRGFS